jgi:hypothetical protein
MAKMAGKEGVKCEVCVKREVVWSLVGRLPSYVRAYVRGVARVAPHKNTNCQLQHRSTMKPTQNSKPFYSKPAMNIIMMKLLLLCAFVSTITAFAPSRGNLAIRSVSTVVTPSAFKSNVFSDRKSVTLRAADKDVTESTEEKEDETKKGFAAIKSAGRAGAISLFLWEAAFWIIAGEFEFCAVLCILHLHECTFHFI